jgi:arsenate reductase
VSTSAAAILGRPARHQIAAGEYPLGIRCAAEFAGTAFLLLAVVGSGIQAQRLSPHDTGLALLENSVATGAALVALILALGPVSGAHFNPVVTAVDVALGRRPRSSLLPYVLAQFGGGAVGVLAANAMFDLPLVTVSRHHRSSAGLWLAEAVATFGLLMVIYCVVRSGNAKSAGYAVGAYITGAYWFTSSTSFANPAVTIARTLSGAFAGIAPASVAPFICAQLAGAGLAAFAMRALTAANLVPSTVEESG